jgi:SAM-dependent methyltransferase
VRARSFGSVAETYERYRMGYPDELVAAVLRYAGRPVHTALEVGAGTGKATRVFGAHGIDVTALEPDPEMARVLRSSTRGLPVQPMVVAFEGFRAGRAFDLVYAAAAWHWTDPATRWSRAADLLVPGGVLALFGRADRLIDSQLAETIDEIERRVLPDAGGPVGAPWSAEDLEQAPGLTDVQQQELPSVTTFPADQWVAREGTASAYLMLSPEERARALREVRAVLPDRVDVDTKVGLTLARRG